MKVIRVIANKFDCHIRHLCDRFTPRQQFIITVLLFTIFTLASIYVLTISAYRVGKIDGSKAIYREHVETVPIYKPLK